MFNEVKTRELQSAEYGERYIVNAVGEPVEVILALDVFEQLLAELHALREQQALQAEMNAWDSASDEALVEFEKVLK